MTARRSLCPNGLEVKAYMFSPKRSEDVLHSSVLFGEASSFRAHGTHFCSNLQWRNGLLDHSWPYELEQSESVIVSGTRAKVVLGIVF